MDQSLDDPFLAPIYFSVIVGGGGGGDCGGEPLPLDLPLSMYRSIESRMSDY